MKWVELSISVDEDDLEKVSGVLDEYGYGGAVTEELYGDSGIKTYTVRAYLPSQRFTKNRGHGIEEALSRLGSSYPLKLHKKVTTPEDWLNSWKRYFRALEIGEKLVIKPGWENGGGTSPRRKVIKIDPGMAFGTGHHATTRLCLRRLEKHLTPGMAVLDLGTGSGVLAIAAAKLGASSVLALDTDSIAVKAARDNSKANDVSDIVRVRKGTLGSRIPKDLENCFDLALANITASVVTGLAGRISTVLKSGGKLIASGINAEGLDETLVRLVAAGLKIEAIDHEEEWHAVIADK